MLFMYTLDRRDVLPADDFGVREGDWALNRLDAAPAAKAIRALSAPWSPHRSAATSHLWRARAARLQSAVTQAPGIGI